MTLRLRDLPGVPAAVRAQAARELGADRARRPAAARSTVTRGSASGLEFPAVCAAVGLPSPVAEHRFAPPRKWALDFAWVEHRVALEVEGWGHRTKARFGKDVAKYNALAGMGWRLIRCTPSTRDTADTLAAVRAALTPTPTDP
jgi:hypothetical protein